MSDIDVIQSAVDGLSSAIQVFSNAVDVATDSGVRDVLQNDISALQDMSGMLVGLQDSIRAADQGGDSVK